jgi:COP9 signalosome complex subunit 4
VLGIDHCWCCCWNLGGCRGGGRNSCPSCIHPSSVYVRIAECFLEEDEIADSDAAVTKAGGVVESITNPDQCMGLILRYKSTYARVLDSNRKFLQAATRYHDLSMSPVELIRAEDLLAMLGRAATCAILAPNGPQKHRVLGHIYKDVRLTQLDGIPQFETHRTILTKMYKCQILAKEELVRFESTLQPHQRAVMGDGLTIMERGVIEQNMLAVAGIYGSIYVNELALKLGVSDSMAEKLAAAMIVDGSLTGSIDEVAGLVEFHSTDETPNSTWDRAVSSFCMDLNRITDTIVAQSKQ